MHTIPEIDQSRVFDRVAGRAGEDGHQGCPFVTDHPHHRHFRQSISRPGPPGDIVTQSSSPPKSDMPLVKVWAMALPGVSDNRHLGQTMGFFRVVSRPTSSSSGPVIFDHGQMQG